MSSSYAMWTQSCSPRHNAKCNAKHSAKCKAKCKVHSCKVRSRRRPGRAAGPTLLIPKFHQHWVWCFGFKCAHSAQELKCQLLLPFHRFGKEMNCLCIYIRLANFPVLFFIIDVKKTTLNLPRPVSWLGQSTYGRNTTWQLGFCCIFIKYFLQKSSWDSVTYHHGWSASR